METTGRPHKQNDQIRVCQKTSQVHIALEQHPIGRWNKNQIVPEWSVRDNGCSVVTGACVTAIGTDCFVFIEDVTADKSNRINSDVYRVKFFVQIKPNAWEFT